MTDSGNYQLESYFAITTNSFLSKRNISSYKKGVNFNGTDYLSTLTAAEIETAGLGTAYATAKWKNSQGNYSLDLTPDRYLFKVRNFAPQINVNKSNFGGISFSETQLNGSLLGLTAQPNAFYPISLFSNESVEFEDDPSDLTVIGSFFQVYAYGGYIHLMSPNYIPRYPFVYNETSESFYSIVAFPGQLNFSRYGETITKTTNSDLESYYSLLIVTVTDKDGGYNDFYFLIVLSDEGDEGQGISLIDYWPLFVLGAVVVVICVVLNRKGKKNEEEALDYMY